MKKPTRINFKTGKFTANGNKYEIVDYLPVGRDLKYQHLSMQMSFGTDFQGIFKLLSETYKLATEGDSALQALHQIATRSRNALEAVKRVGQDEDRIPVYYELCALLCNRQDEDPATITDSQIRDKVEDWKIEGIPREDFFWLAVSSIRGFTDAWKRLEKHQEEAEEAMSAKRRPQKKKAMSTSSSTTDGKGSGKTTGSGGK